MPKCFFWQKLEIWYPKMKALANGLFIMKAMMRFIRASADNLVEEFARHADNGQEAEARFLNIDFDCRHKNWPADLSN